MLSQLFTKLNKKHDLGIVFSGGGARGISHIGVLKALEEADIYPDLVCGVSSGAIVGAFYTDGWKPDDIFRVFKDEGFFSFVRISFPRTGLLRLSGFVKLLKNNLSAKHFEDLKKPLVVNATDFKKGETRFFEEGELIKPVLASSSIPVLFSPVQIGDDIYVDGGLLNNLPYEPLNQYCKKLIGVNANPLGYEKDFNNLVDIAQRTFQLSVASNIMDKKEKFDLLIEPPALNRYNILRLSKAEELYEIGYEFTKQTLRNVNKQSLVG